MERLDGKFISHIGCPARIEKYCGVFACQRILDKHLKCIFKENDLKDNGDTALH
jgi:hypothetical protein